MAPERHFKECHNAQCVSRSRQTRQYPGVDADILLFSLRLLRGGGFIRRHHGLGRDKPGSRPIDIAFFFFFFYIAYSLW